jgi:hypothetical protein
VDKAFKEETTGQEARFKNARLSYYNGDFQWSQAQFDVLKASTSKLISNDALDLSVFIMDNLNLDTFGSRHFAVRRRRTAGVPEPLRRGLPEAGHPAQQFPRTLAAGRYPVPRSAGV